MRRVINRIKLVKHYSKDLPEFYDVECESNLSLDDIKTLESWLYHRKISAQVDKAYREGIIEKVKTMHENGSLTGGNLND